MLALLLRSSVALALAAPPTSTPEASPTPQASPQSREYAGAEVSEAPPAPDDAVIVPPAPADATSEPVAALAPTVAPTVATTPSVTPTPEGPSEDEDAIDELPYDPLVDSPEAVRARHWVRSGAVFLALGAVLTIGAIAMSQAEVNNPETGEMNCNNRGDPAGNGCTQGGRTRSTVATTPSVTPTPEGPSEDEDAIDELPYDPLVDSPEAVRARHWVRSGAVFLALGAVLTIGAIAMSQAEVNNPETGEMNCNNRGDPAGNGCTQGGRTRSTVALAVPGALLLGGGVAMLTVGKLQQRRLAASVRADRQSFALGLSLRF